MSELPQVSRPRWDNIALGGDFGASNDALQRPPRLGHGAEMIERSPSTLTSATTVQTGGYTVTVRGLVLMCSIGIRAREREHRQRVRVSVDLVAADPFPQEERRRIINYEKVVAAIREIANAGHIDLCEGFAERVCIACLDDPRVERVRVWVEKLDVFADAEGVGAVIERTRPAAAGKG